MFVVAAQAQWWGVENGNGASPDGSLPPPSLSAVPVVAPETSETSEAPLAPLAPVDASATLPAAASAVLPTVYGYPFAAPYTYASPYVYAAPYAYSVPYPYAAPYAYVTRTVVVAAAPARP